jgi:hypothetical protein
MINRFLQALITLIALLALLPGTVGRAQEGLPTLQAPSGSETPTSTPDLPQILAPAGGQALQGSVPIEVHIPPVGFASAELSFAYQSGEPRTWFLIAELEQITADPVLAQWDTTTITDGDYTLRLVVTRVDGSRTSEMVTGLRVRNYSPVETITPTPVTPTATPEPGDTPVPTETPTPTITAIPFTPTPLSPNPAQIDRMDILVNMGKGALAVLAFLSVAGLYQSLKTRIRGRDDHLT